MEKVKDSLQNETAVQQGTVKRHKPGRRLYFCKKYEKRQHKNFRSEGLR